MNPPSGRPWLALHTAYQEQLACYTQALAVAERLRASLEQGLPTEGLLDRLDILLGEATRIEAGLEPARRAWEDAGRPMDADLHAIRTRLIDLVERLAAQTGAAAERATAQKAELLPRVEAIARGRQMRQAYQAIRHTPPPTTSGF